MKEKFKLFKIDDLFSVLYGTITVCVLAFSLLTLHDVISGGAVGKWYLFSAFLFLSLSRGLLSIYFHFVKKDNKIGFHKSNAFAFVYFVIAILVATLFSDKVEFYQAIAVLYLSTVGANRLCLIFENRKTANVICNGVLFTFVTLMVISLCLPAKQANSHSYLTLLIVVLMLVSFAEVLAFAFSKIKLRGLLKIIRNTYVIEIIYGLLVLMVSFSFYFMLMEENIKNFGDAMWFSFSLVTTIGLGDLTAVTPAGRVLGVILGIYGLIVVASFTSVFVNFYNESKSSKKDEEKTIEEQKEENTKSSDDKK